MDIIMPYLEETYDIVVVGAGHAGCDFAINGRFDVVAFHLLQNRHQKKPLVAIDTLPGLYYISLFQGTYMLSEADLLCVEFLINVTMLADD